MERPGKAILLDTLAGQGRRWRDNAPASIRLERRRHGLRNNPENRRISGWAPELDGMVWTQSTGTPEYDWKKMRRLLDTPSVPAAWTDSPEGGGAFHTG